MVSIPRWLKVNIDAGSHVLPQNLRFLLKSKLSYLAVAQRQVGKRSVWHVEVSAAKLKQLLADHSRADKAELAQMEIKEELNVLAEAAMTTDRRVAMLEIELNEAQSFIARLNKKIAELNKSAPIPSKNLLPTVHPSGLPSNRKPMPGSFESGR